MTADHALQTLRYGPDQLIVNCFGELVWLASFATDSQRGLTECCFAESPCRYHHAIESGLSPVPWVPDLSMVRHWPGARVNFEAPTRQDSSGGETDDH